jgi:hypothetical protein
VPFIESDGRGIVNSSFKAHGLAGRFHEALLSSKKQPCSQSGTPIFRQNVDADDVAHAPATAFGNDEAGYPFKFCRILSRCISGQGDNGKGPSALHICGQLTARIRNPWIKAFLVNLPEGIEILGPEWTQYDLHAAIVAGILQSN